MTLRELLLKPKIKDIGDGFKVRRLLPAIDCRAVGPFVFWDHMGPVTFKDNEEMIVKAHPHIGLATITYLFSGEILHRDSLGNELSIKPGEVNWMTAGSGIVHSERSFERTPPEELEGIQLWVGLPNDKEDVPPSFSHFKSHELPKIQEGGCRLHLIAGEAFGKMSPVPVYSELFYMIVDIDQGAKFLFDLSHDHEGAVYVVQGKVKTDQHELNRFDMNKFSKGSKVEFEAVQNAKVMVFGGRPFENPKRLYWNFVSHSSEKIEDAKRRWENREFDPVINETEFTPLP